MTVGIEQEACDTTHARRTVRLPGKQLAHVVGKRDEQVLDGTPLRNVREAATAVEVVYQLLVAAVLHPDTHEPAVRGREADGTAERIEVVDSQQVDKQRVRRLEFRGIRVRREREVASAYERGAAVRAGRERHDHDPVVGDGTGAEATGRSGIFELADQFRGAVMDQLLRVHETRGAAFGVILQTERRQFAVAKDLRKDRDSLQGVGVEQGAPVLRAILDDKVAALVPDERGHHLRSGPVVLPGQGERRHRLHLGILQAAPVDFAEGTQELREILDVGFLDAEAMPQPLVHKKRAHVEEPRECVNPRLVGNGARPVGLCVESRGIHLHGHGIKRADHARGGKVRHPRGTELQQVGRGGRIGKRTGYFGKGLAPAEHADPHGRSRLALELLQNLVYGFLRTEAVVHHPEIKRIGTDRFPDDRLGMHRDDKRHGDKHQRKKVLQQLTHLANFAKSSK